MSIYYDLSFSAYRELPGWNWSRIKLMRNSPAHVLHDINTDDDGDTASRRKLRAVHAAVLEPDVYRREYVVCDVKRDKRTKAYKTFMEMHPDTEHLTPTEAADIAATARAIKAHPAAGRLLSDGIGEVTITWTDEETGLPCKGRIDWLAREDSGQFRSLADLKTFGTTHPREVGRMVAQQGAHGQQAHYRKGLAANGIIGLDSYIISAEGKGAQDVALFDLGAGIVGSAYEAGEHLRARLMRRIAEHVESDIWPGRCPGIEDLTLPDWAYPDEGGE